MAHSNNDRARGPVIHPWPIRLTHWLNAVAIIMMIGSGWQIYDASPLFDFEIPPLLTIGGWLGAGIAWHLAFMWLLVANGLIYLVYSASTGRFRRFFPVRPREVLADLGAALRLRLRHERGVYNAVQRTLYLGVMLAVLTVVISGLAIWKPVQLWFFCNLCGGYFAARYVHFTAMAVIVTFLVIHVALTVMVPRVLPPMITGGRLKP